MFVHLRCKFCGETVDHYLRREWALANGEGKPSSVTGVGAPLATREASQSTGTCPPQIQGKRETMSLTNQLP
jgi:hypothetical protein